MPSSAVRTFSDPDDFAAAIRGGTAEITVIGRGEFTAKLFRIDLHRLWLQTLFEALPRVAHAVNLPGRAGISFHTSPGQEMVSSGLEMDPTDIIRYSDGQSYYQRRSGPSRVNAMSLPLEELAAISESLAATDLHPPRDAKIIAPPPAAMERLQRLHAAVQCLAEDAPEIIAHPEAARGLEQALIEAMVDCLASREPRANTLAQGQHAIVMRRFRRVVEENPEHPLYIPEICKTIGVSGRTLQACCHEHLGMGPKHYLLLRRMHLVRRALHQSVPETASVTEIATRYGFWQLGRFAVEYQSLYGEPPSATLARQFA
jgi:AraC-like DNA-binding protein